MNKVIEDSPAGEEPQNGEIPAGGDPSGAAAGANAEPSTPGEAAPARETPPSGGGEPLGAYAKALANKMAEAEAKNANPESNQKANTKVIANGNGTAVASRNAQPGGKETRTGTGVIATVKPTVNLKSAEASDSVPAGEDESDAIGGEQSGSGNYIHPDVGAASSQRLRLVPPNVKRVPWHVRYHEQLMVAEIILTGLFFLLAVYLFYLWLFTKHEPVAFAPSREGFIQALSLFPPMPTDPAWRIKATPGRWRNIVVHHTAADTGSPESIDRFHREVRKWENGLGYHFLIGNGFGMGDGQVASSRRWLEQLDGAHVKVPGKGKANSYSIGVALVGNFENHVATPRQLAALRGLLSFLLSEYGIKNSEIVGHGQVALKHTECPGKLFFLDEVMKTL